MQDGTGLFPILRVVIYNWAPGLQHQGFDPSSYTAALLEEAPNLVSKWCWGTACQEFPKEVSQRADSQRSNPAMGNRIASAISQFNILGGKASWNRPELFLFQEVWVPYVPFLLLPTSSDFLSITRKHKITIKLTAVWEEDTENQNLEPILYNEKTSSSLQIHPSDPKRRKRLHERL